ncbi:MAG: signal peptidase I [Candidatus Zixiibacteriota bacterium]|nr:MAG: signal peptidase I [candidate division Zixibacteria bacterium]
MSQEKRKSRPAPPSAWENTRQILIAVVLALLIKTSIVEAYKIPTASMEDTLLVGDFLLANKFIYGAQVPLTNWHLPAIRDPRPGDIIIFIPPPASGQSHQKYIKRCVGGPGDTIVYKNKQLYVNGKLFPNPPHAKFVDTNFDGSPRIQPRGPGGRNSRDNFGPFVVPPNSYFMMGDNRDNSFDSRYWGAVPRQSILGEAMVVHWSWNEAAAPSPEVSVSDPLSVPRLFVFNIAHFFEKVRWHRLFRVIR